MRTMYGVDVAGSLAALTMPILILHAQDDPLIPFALGRELSIRLPQARFVPFQGTLALPWSTGRAVLLAEIRSFLDVGSAPTKRDDDANPSLGSALGSARSLTPRELEVLRLVARGKSNREIAHGLVLSVRTVERHVSNICTKIEVRTRAQATAYALSHGLVSLVTAST
jgi:DNA-binding CsgD family transcriptional regulator